MPQEFKNALVVFPMNPIFAEYYLKKISEGKTKHQALICVMRRIISIIFNMLKYDTEYKAPAHLIEECKTKFIKRQQEDEETAEKIMKKKAVKNSCIIDIPMVKSS